MADHSRSTTVPYRPSPSSSTRRQVTVKQEWQYEPTPPPRSVTERFVPYAGYLSQDAGSTSITKHEAPATPSTNAAPVPTLPPHHLNEVAAIAVGSLSIQEPQDTLSGMDLRPVEPNTVQGIAPATPKQRSSYSWAKKYNKECVTSLAITIEERHLKKAERGSIAKTLKAAKETILELPTEEETDKLDLGKIPAQWTRLKKIARQLDVLIPHEFIPKAPGLLAMDRMIRATKSYIYHLRARTLTAGINTAQAISETEPGRILNEGLEPDDEAVKAYLKRKKRLKQKEWRKKAKIEAQAVESKESASELESSPLKPISKKRKRESQHVLDEEVATQSLKGKKQKSTGLLIEEEISHPEPEVPQPRKTKKQKKTPVSVKKPIAEPVPDKVKIKKQKRPFLLVGDVPSEASPEKQKNKSKKPAIPDKDKIPDIAPAEPKAKKHKKAKISTGPIDDTPAIVSQNTTFDFDTSFIGETLESTEHRANRLADEVRNLKAMLHAVGVTAGSVSVGLTRMRHGQSAEEIFSGSKRDGHEV